MGENTNWLPSTEDIEIYETVPLSPEARLAFLEKQVQFLADYEENRKARAKAYKENLSSRTSKKHFTKIYKVKGRELTNSKLLSKAEKAFLFDIIPYISMKIPLLTDEDGVPINTKKLMSICNISKSTFYTITSHLTKIGILIPVTDCNQTFYRLNQEYFDCG